MEPVAGWLGDERIRKVLVSLCLSTCKSFDLPKEINGSLLKMEVHILKQIPRAIVILSNDL